MRKSLSACYPCTHPTGVVLPPLPLPLLLSAVATPAVPARPAGHAATALRHL